MINTLVWTDSILHTVRRLQHIGVQTPGLLSRSESGRVVSILVLAFTGYKVKRACRQHVELRVEIRYVFVECARCFADPGSSSYSMTDQEAGGLRGLQQDLIALDESRLQNIDRLWADLEARIEEFRRLLDKPQKNDSSRKELLSGNSASSSYSRFLAANSPRVLGDIRVGGEQYAVNDEFKQSALQLADGLDLDELESARLLLDTQEDAEISDRSNTSSAVVRFHERRQFLLESLRLVLKQATDPDKEEGQRDVLRQLVALILETKDGPARNGSLFAQKCLSGMAGIERWLQALGDRVQGAVTLGQISSPEQDEVLQFQQASLGQQHESLSAVITYLIKANYTGVEDFYKVLDHLPSLVKWNSVALHYVPTFIALSSQYGSPEGSSSFNEAKMLNQRIVDGRDSKTWPLRNFQAATITWWLAEYSGWFLEQIPGSPMQGMDLISEAQKRSAAFFGALSDGAFQCTLSVCSQLRPIEWYDPVRSGLIQFLLRDAPALPLEVMYTSTYLQDLIMEHFEIFVDSFISNMPDTLRKLKVEEDDQRRQYLAKMQSEPRNNLSAEQEFHLERFLAIISYAYDDRIDAAQSFWADTDSNLYGFLQWASRRQSTPRAAAFCELLRSISKDEECATSAHHFLLDEGNTTPARIRRSSSLSWAQIFDELRLYTSLARDPSTANRPGPPAMSKERIDEIDEPESALMLESYLRLMSHLCRGSTEVRFWILDHPTERILDELLLLSNTVAPGRIQACAFSVMRSLLTDKTTDLGMTVWAMLDQWVSSGFSQPIASMRSAKASVPPAESEDTAFALIAHDFETSCEFVNLLHILVAPAITDSGLNDALPFPEQLGSAYRMPGIEPYIDFVFGKLFIATSPGLDDPLQLRITRCNILNFATICLATFNEDLLVLANRSTLSVDNVINTSSLSAYVRLHPFGRVMEWMFNDKVLTAIFATAHQDINEVSNSSPDSPLITSVLRAIEVMSLTMELQSTYLELARPQIKLHSVGPRKPVINPTLASFEDSVATHMNLINDLGFYAGTGLHDLVVSSLRLLEKLASSRRLNHQPVTISAKRHGGNRLVEALEQQGDTDHVARSLITSLDISEREISEGDQAPGWIIKSVILDFLIHCLSASPNKPTLAHALLGFTCSGDQVESQPDGLFARGSSLFHAILDLVIDYPDGEGANMAAWSLSIKQKAMQVLRELWTSPLTAVLTLSELRASDFLFALFLRQKPIGPNTEWDGEVFSDPDFLYSDSSIACNGYLMQRCALLEYTSADIRLATVEAASSMKARIVSTLLGTTSMPDGHQEVNASIFDLLDFSELDVPERAQPPITTYFSEVDFSASFDESLGPGVPTWSIKLVEEMIALRLNELRFGGNLQDNNADQQAMTEAQTLLVFFQGENQRHALQQTSLRIFKAWTDTLRLMLTDCDLEVGRKAALILQSLQLINPKLDRYAEANAPQALDLARLAHALLMQLDFDTSTIERAKGGDITNDKLFQTFRTALRAIQVSDEDSQLRETLYHICYRYLAGTATSSDAVVRRRHNTSTVKVAGGKLIGVICDDAYGGSGTCRISALMLLDALVALAKADNSAYIIDSLVRTNFIVVLVETIKDIAPELRQTSAHGTSQRELLRFDRC